MRWLTRSVTFRSEIRSTPQTQIGPLVSERQRERVEGYLDLARSRGCAGDRRRPAR